MRERESLTLPYTFGFAALTFAAVLGFTSHQSIVPSQCYELNGRVAVGKPWESFSGTSSPLAEIDVESISQIKSIQAFADNLLKDTIDLDPRIVEVVNDRFWDMLA